MLNVEYSPPRRGGEAAASTKSCEATEKRRRRGGQLGEIFRPEQFRRTDHPGRAVSEGIHFIYGASTPPLRGGEYSARVQFIHTTIDRPYSAFVVSNGFFSSPLLSVFSQVHGVGFAAVDVARGIGRYAFGGCAAKQNFKSRIAGRIG